MSFNDRTFEQVDRYWHAFHTKITILNVMHLGIQQYLPVCFSRVQFTQQEPTQLNPVQRASTVFNKIRYLGKYNNSVTSHDITGFHRTVNNRSICMGPRPGYKLQWPCTRRLGLDILMSRITHNNQDVIFQQPTPRTPTTSRNIADNARTDQTHKRGVSTMLRFVSEQRATVSPHPFNTKA